MAKKITVSVPDELHERMMVCKDSFNFSQVFQNAISDLIQKREDFQKRLKGDENMNAVIERLKKEKEESENVLFETGKNEGLRWAKMSHYDELMVIVNVENDKIPFQKLAEIDYGNEDFFSDQEHPIDENFEAGFVEGVKEFYDEIQAKLDKPANKKREGLYGDKR